jgi:(p)ppGpp synthase/HD superfamily hydrolase
MDSLSATLLRAAQFAAECHAAQRRKGARSEPYVNHLIEVAAILADVAGDRDPNLLVAALLHDSIEDVGVTREEIAARFNDDVAELVWLVTDDKSLEKHVRKQLQVDNAPHKPTRAQWLKIADKTSNLRAIRDSPPPEWTSDRCREYLAWARRVVSAFPDPHPVLLAQFEQVAAELETRFGCAPAASADV